MIKKLSLSIVLLFFTITIYPQKKQFINNLNFEFGWGLNYPLKLSDNFFFSPDYFGIKSFYIGGNYKVNEIWGLRSTYAYNQLDDSGYSNLGIRRYKLTFEPTFDFITALRVKRNLSKPRFDIRLHGGAGMSLAQSLYLARADDITFTAQLGAMPMLRIVDKMFITLDCVLVVDFGQKYDTHGVPAQHKTGAYLLTNIGLSYTLSY